VVVICVDNSGADYYLTVGKAYKVVKEGESGGVSIIWVEDDTGRSFGFFPSRFSPFPVEQLEDWL